MKLACVPEQLLEHAQRTHVFIISADRLVQKYAARTAKSVQMFTLADRLAHRTLMYECESPL